MHSEVIIREATIDDAETIIRFQKAMAKETEAVELDDRAVTEGVRRVFRDPQLGKYFVATIDGRVVAGLMITYEWSDWRSRTVWWIQSVFVEEASRRRRIYGKMYEHVQSLANADANVAGIRLYVDRHNVRAQEVYRRLGMNGDHYRVFEWMKES